MNETISYLRAQYDMQKRSPLSLSAQAMPLLPSVFNKLSTEMSYFSYNDDSRVTVAQTKN